MCLNMVTLFPLALDRGEDWRIFDNLDNLLQKYSPFKFCNSDESEEDIKKKNLRLHFNEIFFGLPSEIERLIMLYSMPVFFNSKGDPLILLQAYKFFSKFTKPIMCENRFVVVRQLVFGSSSCTKGEPVYDVDFSHFISSLVATVTTQWKLLYYRDLSYFISYPKMELVKCTEKENNYYPLHWDSLRNEAFIETCHLRNVIEGKMTVLTAARLGAPTINPLKFSESLRILLNED